MPVSKLKSFLYKSRLIRSASLSVKLAGTEDCVFIWIPKTAGTSLYYWLNKNMGMCKMNVPRDFMAFPGSGAVTFGHVHYLSILYAGFVPLDFDAKAFKFAIVRDPYERVVSLYNYLKDDQKYTNSFSGFLNEIKVARPPVGLYNHRGLSQTNPQVDWLMGFDGRFITNAVYKVEVLEQAINDLSARFSIEEPFPIIGQNISKKHMLVSNLNDKEIKLINLVYERDFELLDYKML